MGAQKDKKINKNNCENRKKKKLLFCEETLRLIEQFLVDFETVVQMGLEIKKTFEVLINLDMKKFCINKKISERKYRFSMITSNSEDQTSVGSKQLSPSEFHRLEL